MHSFWQLVNHRCLSIVGLLLGAHSDNSGANNPGITIKYQNQEQVLNVKHCFSQAPDYIETKDNQIIQLTQSMHWQSKPISFERGYAELPEGESGCVSYVIQTKTINSSRRLKQQHSDSLLVKINSILWQISDHDQRPLPRITINHNPTINVSAPWQLIKRSNNQTIYQMKPTPRYADGYVAFGPLEIKHLMLGDSRLRLAVMPGKFKNKGELINQWVKTMANSVAQVGDSFPLNDIQVLVVLIDGNGGAVPWGQVNRGGGQGVLFVVNANKPKQQLFADWTAAHEFSHLLTPYTPNDRWLSEGFASYHQNISRLRSGMLDENTAWSKLVAGFERGQSSAVKSTAPTLKKSNRKHNMQMYWGGAVIALKADVALQNSSQGNMSLSMALSGLKDCCLDTGKSWSAKQLFTELDNITQTDVFMSLYQQEVLRKPYPEYQSVLQSLGINKTPSGEVRLNDLAPNAAIRKRISQG